MADDSQVLAVITVLDKFAEKLIKKLTLDITANLKETTPVLTGWARANWVPTIGEKYATSYGDLSIKEREALVSNAEGDAASGAASIGGYTLERGATYISNNVPYIIKLNAGSSAKAPAAFIQSSIQRAVDQNQGFKG